MAVNKTKLTAGADERTPSLSQYFSWINNTNEGSTEHQTLINLDYFKWLHDSYGMQLDIYAWDAGNLDGSRGTYQSLNSPKIRSQYPNGYAPITKKAKEINTHLGVWCGPDGFGTAKEQAQARKETMVSLCRDYNFALFKMDSVCGSLSDEKQNYFVDMMKECRKYQPDLVLLNHRLELGKGMPYATTFLWEGLETYIDVHVANSCTSLHHRAYLFGRNTVPGLERLAEDHGVCISSCPDYFEDDLIYQAFNRCLILAPEVYGNPWFLRDDEQAHLAHIYNLHRRYRDILVDAVVIPEEYSKNCTSRGDGRRQFVTLGNCSWKSKKVNMVLDERIGLKKLDKAAVFSHHPYEKFIGVFAYGECVEITVDAFRASLIEVCDCTLCGTVLSGCAYEVLHETDSGADIIKVIESSGEVKLTDISNGTEESFSIPVFDNTNREPEKIGSAVDIPVPHNAEQLVEATLFAADNDSLEARAVKRSGDTKIAQVQAARNEFFSQKLYSLRGCEGKFAFDSNKNTYFDGCSKQEFGGMRIGGGCLRVDFGRETNADCVLIEYFTPFEGRKEFAHQSVTDFGSFSTDLFHWETAKVISNEVMQDNAEIEYIRHCVHDVFKAPGQRRCISYSVGSTIRYFRLDCPMDRIFSISLQKNGKKIALESPTVSNLFRPYSDAPVECAKMACVCVEKAKWREGCFIAVALEGKCGSERAYAAAEIDGKCVGFPERAPSYPSNAWECPVRSVDGWYTYYLPVTEEMTDKNIDIWVLTLEDGRSVPVDIYLCDGNEEKKGIEIELNRPML